MPLSIDLSLVRAWAIQFNRAHREASINASMWRLRFAAAFIFGALVFLAGRALAETNADVPTGKPDAVIDLATKEGVDLVKGQWCYSDTKIIQVDFKAAGPDKQPTGKPIKTYDFTPHAGGVDFDDSKWEKIDPTTLDARRSTGRLCFNWYRINITIPPSVNDVDVASATAVFETSIDDYAEVWVDGELSRALGQSGGSVVKGWNAPNRLIINRSVQPGQKIQLAIFGVNGPLSNPPTNYIYMREAKLEFYKGGLVPVAITPSEVNVEVIRKDPAIDAIVPPNPKIFKLAEGFKFTEGPVWDRKGGFLLFSDPNNNTIYKYSPEGNGQLAVFRNKSGYEGADIAEYGQPGSNGLTFDPQGRLTIDQHGNHRVVRVEPDGQLTVLADKFEGKRLNSPNDLVYRSDGTLYFTDPPFGLPKFFNDPRKELPFSGVFAVKERKTAAGYERFHRAKWHRVLAGRKILVRRRLGREEEGGDVLRSGARRLTQERQTIFRHDQGAGRRRARRNESGQSRKPLRFRSGWSMDSLAAGQTSRHNYSAKAPAQFRVGRCRWEDALPLREEWTLSDATERRRSEAVSNAPSANANDSASPLEEGERIEVRGSPTRHRRFQTTLTLPSPFGRERQMAGGDLL